MAIGSKVTGNGLETAFVLFFLSVDFGQNILKGSSDIAFLGITVIVLAVLPYCLPFTDGISLTSWLFGRFAIVTLGLTSGIAFNQVIGVFLPESLGYLPFALAIASGCFACYFMFLKLFRVRFAN